VKVLSSKRRTVAAGVLILLVLFALRPGASRLKSRIIASISSALGRSVDIGAVHLRLLPRPSFDLENLVVYDDPAFGAEPMLRAGEVTAALRLTSLVRGRLEIARLDLTEPSLNLVHGENGRWNLEALLERSAHTPLAPTAKPKSEARQGFPYIQATSARINFKRGAEKRPFALTNADFSLWQESENTWGVRLKAQPVRTDLNSNDTGILQVSGTWQRADILRNTPLEFSMEWSRAQLGQLTKLFTGSDLGWRGAVQLDVTLMGTPAKLAISSDAFLQDFRRYDITSGQALTLAGHCDGHYSSPEHVFHETFCTAPVGNGEITLKGNMGLPGSHYYELVVTAENVPASAGIILAHRTKKNLPDDLVAGGNLHGSISIERGRSQTAQLRLVGHGDIEGFRLASAANKTAIGPETIPFVFTSGDQDRSPGAKKRTLRQSPHAPDGTALELGPFPVAMGRGTAPTVRGWIGRTGYDISVSGDAEIGKALQLAQMFGLPALKTTAAGIAELDLHVAGAWARWAQGNQSSFAGPRVTGTAKLHGIEVALRGLAGPMQIASAEMELSADEVRVRKLNAHVADALWSGSLEMQRGCGTPAACEVRFNLKANHIAFPELSAWVHPRASRQPWYRVLESSAHTGPSFLGSLRASGRLTADRLQLPNLSASHLSASVVLDSGKMSISELNADFLGGKHRGKWQADFTSKPAVCDGSGNLTGISLERMASNMKGALAGGTANASYELKGPCTAEFWSSAEGAAQFDMRDAAFPRVSLAEDEGPLKIWRLSGSTHLQDGILQVKNAKLESPSGKFDLSGTAGLNRQLDLKLAWPTGGSGGYAITGTLLEPRVTQLPGPEQARLKPESAK
jgi:hypothetical protein